MMPSRGGVLSALAFILTALALAPLQSQALEDADVPRTNENRTLYAIPVPLPYDSLQSAKPGIEKSTLEQTQFHLWSYISSDYDASKIKRAVVTLHGQGRDAWSYWDDTYDALFNATSPTKRSSKSLSTSTFKNRTSLKRDEVLILAPLFFNNQDTSAYQALDEEFDSQSIVWNGGDWAEGADSILPDTVYGSEEGQTFEAPKVSSYEALDEVVRWFSDKNVFPKMETVLIAGHSMGGQIAQRYALLGAVPSASTPVHFVVANPGSFAWLTPERPEPVDDCPDTYNLWKYGLELSSDGTWSQRYLKSFIQQSLDAKSEVLDVRVRYSEIRLVHYLFGLDDFGPGDTRCQALTQGPHHLGRGQNFLQHLDTQVLGPRREADAAQHGSDNLQGWGKASHTSDFVKGCSHDPMCMWLSKQGIERLFFTNADGEEGPRGVGDDDAVQAKWYPWGVNSATSHFPSWSTSTMLGALAASICVAWL
ncbi:hypothetical protein CBOM_00553 [Ceraceosorus bombacis]|uniref:GPI inositol-deacylase n=1 Tax=Ceraceosorus bombacis TaxID=401625 RepID=A0A0N7L922_9BASI|nr:hypothetical protein CBOM_00553 [Ceraceosorus bombacis]